jgi:hypothetical protein
MKKLLFLGLLFTISVFSFGQIDFGIKAGINTGWVNMKDVLTVEEGVEEYSVDRASDLAVGFHAGLMLRISLFKAYIQPEIYFSSTQGNLIIKDIHGTNPDKTEWDEKLRFGRLDIPVMVGYKAGPVRLQLGPIASILISEDADILDLSGFKENFKTATIGYQAGIGFDIVNTLTLDFRYEGNLSKLGDEINLGGGNSIALDTRVSQLVISIGVLF